MKAVESNYWCVRKMAQVKHCQYGKSRVRVVRVDKCADGTHEIREVTVQVLLEGQFADSFQKADNSLVVPTDTCKNNVYCVAKTSDFKCIETFAQKLVEHFLANYGHVSLVRTEMIEGVWERLLVDGKPHKHSFTKKMAKRYCRAVGTRSELKLWSGIRDFVLLKTTGSGFTNFHRCRYTTLPDYDDRILATNAECTWQYRSVNGVDFDAVRRRVEEKFIKIFADTYSISVQATIWDVSEALLKEVPEIQEISSRLPNLHHWPVDIAKFGLRDDGDIFVAVDEPHGDIQCTIARQTARL